jgi:hypothetical protein
VTVQHLRLAPDNGATTFAEGHMATEALRIELAEVEDLAALVDEVRQSRQPRILRQDGEDVAVLAPAGGSGGTTRRARLLRRPTAEEIARSRTGIEAAAGSWSDVDTDVLKQELARQREVKTRPPVEL